MRSLWALCAFLLSAGTGLAAGVNVLAAGVWARAARVVDGDTFVTARGEHVRLLGINAPEIAHGGEPGEPLGEMARAWLRKRIEGRLVELVFDVQRRDAYGRLLAQVFLRDGSWINGELVERGLAHVYTFEPNHRFAARLLALEQTARKARRGIWRTSRFAVVDARRVGRRMIGQYRVVQGIVQRPRRWRFRLGRLVVSIPRKARVWFDGPLRLHEGMRVEARGVIRMGRRGTLYLALHSPWDLRVPAGAR